MTYPITFARMPTCPSNNVPPVYIHNVTLIPTVDLRTAAQPVSLPRQFKQLSKLKLAEHRFRWTEFRSSPVMAANGLDHGDEHDGQQRPWQLGQQARPGGVSTSYPDDPKVCGQITPLRLRYVAQRLVWSY